MTSEVSPSTTSDAIDTAAEHDDTALSVGAADRVLKAIPEEVRDSFSAVQRHALGVALARAKPGKFLVNLRFSMLGLFFAFIVGKENRSAQRRKLERAKHPIMTPGNLMIMFMSWPVGVLLGWATYVLLIHGEI